MWMVSPAGFEPATPGLEGLYHGVYSGAPIRCIPHGARVSVVPDVYRDVTITLYPWFLGDGVVTDTLLDLHGGWQELRLKGIESFTRVRLRTPLFNHVLVSTWSPPDAPRTPDRIPVKAAQRLLILDGHGLTPTLFSGPAIPCWACLAESVGVQGTSPPHFSSWETLTTHPEDHIAGY